MSLSGSSLETREGLVCSSLLVVLLGCSCLVLSYGDYSNRSAHSAGRMWIQKRGFLFDKAFDSQGTTGRERTYVVDCAYSRSS